MLLFKKKVFEPEVRDVNMEDINAWMSYGFYAQEEEEEEEEEDWEDWDEEEEE